MKRTGIALGLLLAVLLFAAASPILASPPADAPAGPMLMTLAPAFSAGGMPSQFYQRVQDQISRVVPVLASLQKHGHLRGFAQVPGTNAIRVDAPDAQAAMLLHSLPGVAGLAPATPQRVQAARTAFRTAMSQVQGQVAPASLRGLNPRAPSDTPWVVVHETWDYVYGRHFTAGASVTAVLKDHVGNVKATVTPTVDSNQEFYADFPVDVIQGDSVDVSVPTDSFNETVHSDAITINFDYTNDKVYGTVSPGREVDVQARGSDTTTCNYASKEVLATATGDGSYVADFSSGDSEMDINRHSEADVSSIDANGNSWVLWRHAPWARIELNLTNNDGYGYALQPNDDLTITLKNGAGTKQIVTPSSNYPDASFGFRFDQADILPGDTVEITEQGTTWMSIVIPTLTTNLDPVTNLVTGSGPASKPVSVLGVHYNRTNGNWEGNCQVVTANATGKYTANFHTDFLAGDEADTYSIFDQGDDLRFWDHAPYLEPLKDQNIAEGRFHSSFDGNVGIVVKNAAGATKYKGTGYAFGGWWSQILASKGLPVILVAGDKVTVTPALPAKGTLTATIAKLTAKLDVANDKITGTAPANAYVGVYGFYWAGGGYNCDQCWWTVKAGPTGAYSFQFDRDLVAGDYVQVHYVDAGGNRTVSQGFSTNPTIALVSAPPIFRSGRHNYVTYRVTGGVNVENLNMAWDSVSRPDWSYTNWYCPDDCPWPLGGPGDYTIDMGFGMPGTIYFRGFAWVDDRLIFTVPEISAPAR
jgi:hypothetical protein